uniref:Transcription factor MRR1 n=1 Tax=Candida parapsilosis TaxID=5480 RepID=A0A7D5GSK8_CANPA|nr:transcription factor MRR1 [Candida parapsilosis]
MSAVSAEFAQPQTNEIKEEAKQTMQHQHQRRRKRPSLVCTNCKKRKIKCDRQLPCSNCVKARGNIQCCYDEEGFIDLIQKSETEIRPYEQSAKQPLSFVNNSSPTSTAGSSSRKRGNTSQEESGSKKSKDTTSDQLSNSLLEIKMLKQRLESIESNLHHNGSSNENSPNYQTPPANKHLQLAQTAPYSIPSPVLPRPTIQPSLSTIYNLSNTRSPSSIQLPSIRDHMPPHESPISSSITGQSVSSTATSPNYIPPDSRTNLLGVNPYLNEMETINFFDNYSSICCKDFMRVNYGPFAWTSMMKRDDGLLTLWEFISKQKESSQNFVVCPVSNEVTKENTQVVISDNNESDMQFRKRMLETNGYSDVVPYNMLKSKLKSKPNKETLQLELTLFDNQLGCELLLIDRIRRTLPSKKVVWKLIDRFFEWCYPFMPFLIEEEFIEWTEKIIGPRSYEDVPFKDLKIEKRLDLALVGTLLITMRLSYLSLFSNKTSENEERLNTTDPNPKAQDTKYLMQNPIGIESIEIARYCFYQFDILRRASLPLIQLGLYMKIYYMFAPEDGDDGDGADSNGLSALVVQMAYSLGLNREPDNFPDVLTDKRKNHLGREIWQVIVMSDLYQAYSYGSQMLISPDSYDTKPPFSTEENSNLKDKNLDKYITDLYFSKDTGMTNVLRELLKKILSLTGRTKLSELTNLISELEVRLGQSFGSLKECLQANTYNTHVFARNFPAKHYISMKSFLVSTFYHIFLHYENKDVQLTYFYLKKIIQIAAIDLMPHYFELMGNSAVICDMFINPKLQHIIHKLNQLNIAVIIRVNLTIYRLKSQPDHESRCLSDNAYYEYYKELCKLSSCLTRSAEVSIAAVSKLSSRYFYAWKLTKSHSYFLKVVTSMDFYNDNLVKANSKVRFPDFSTAQIKELVNLCEGTLRRLGKVELMGKEFCKDVTYTQYANNNDATSSMSSTSKDTGNLSTPTSDTSIGEFTKEFGLDYLNSEDIDRIWLQMLSQNQQQQSNQQLNYGISQQQSQSQSQSQEQHSQQQPQQQGSFQNYSLQQSQQPQSQSSQQRPQQQQPIGNSGQPQRWYGISSGPNWQGGAAFNSFDAPVTPGFVTNGGLDDINSFDFFNDLPLDQVFSS